MTDDETRRKIAAAHLSGELDRPTDDLVFVPTRTTSRIRRVHCWHTCISTMRRAQSKRRWSAHGCLTTRRAAR
jgi:hypothetical protein